MEWEEAGCLKIWKQSPLGKKETQREMWALFLAVQFIWTLQTQCNRSEYISEVLALCAIQSLATCGYLD